MSSSLETPSLEREKNRHHTTILDPAGREIPKPPSNTISDPDGREIPNPTLNAFPPTKTVGEMMENIQKWAKDQGFAVVKRQGGNKWVSREGDGDYRYYGIYCAQGATRDAEGCGLRSSSTRKLDCSWRG